MTHENLSLGMCWKLFQATLNVFNFEFTAVGFTADRNHCFQTEKHGCDNLEKQRKAAKQKHYC